MSLMSPQVKKLIAQHSPDSLTIVAISDTHQLHREVEVSAGDLLIHTGDFTMFSKSAAAILDFNDWLGELLHFWKIVVPGNHEFFLEADPSRRKLITNATLLINESIEIMGLKVWGRQRLPSWAKPLASSLTLIERGSTRVSPAIQMFL